MDKRLQAYLDGELGLEALPAELREDAARWEQLNTHVTELRGQNAPPWLETRIMANLPAHVALPWWRRGIIYLFQPQPVTVRPAALGLAGAAAVLGILLLNQPEPPNTVVVPAGSAHTVSATAPVIYVQFAFADPTAVSVTVAGDFNDWDAEATALRDSDGDGVWTGLIALRPGMHKYMFVVNGETWVTDPEAERYVDDGFGMRNAVVAVSPPGRSI